MRFGMKSAGNGTELGGLETVGTLRATKQEARKIGDFSPLCCRQCLAQLDEFHGFRAHGVRIAEKTEGAIRAKQPEAAWRVAGKK